MAIDRNKLRNQILADARDGATKSNAMGMNPELYQAIALLVAYVDQDYSGIVENERGIYRAKPAEDLKQ
jgi:hypothetical protein